MLLEEQRRQVIETAREALQTGLIMLTTGNFSLRDPETGYMCITPSGMDYQQVTPADIVVMDTKGTIIDGDRKPSIEGSLHRFAYEKRPDIFGVCHSHSPYATAWASVEEPFPLIVAELAGMLGSNLMTAPFFPMGSMELAEVTIRVLGNQNAVLMSNHGQLTVGPSLPKALAHARLIEEAAKIACFAKSIGTPRIISEEKAESLKKWLATHYGQQ
ncbi:class II aldolase/adducin family protein [Dehalobacter sp. DCM]|uniref:class II aldolase/adducin family protein n=1 Tax=Dehalobacter sp. DCM TaxID=2907827 RepID=UPI0030818007|nr:class II aldolase/adducin family protein [Dehalobacter sp. DCM]